MAIPLRSAAACLRGGKVGATKTKRARRLIEFPLVSRSLPARSSRNFRNNPRRCFTRYASAGAVDAKSFHKRGSRARCGEQTTVNQCASSARSAESFLMDSASRGHGLASWRTISTPLSSYGFVYVRTKIIRCCENANVKI